MRTKSTRWSGCGLGLMVAVALQLGCTTPPPAARQASPPPAPTLSGAAKIEPPLQRELAGAHEDEYVPIVIVLRPQLDAGGKLRALRGLEGRRGVERKRQQRELLVAELKRVARTSQAELLGLLRKLEADKRVRQVRPLWLVNAVGIAARPSAIAEIAKLREVARLHLDVPRPVKGEVVWGVAQINADDVWALPTPFNGSGVTVAVLDTGVDYTHGDLAGRMWINAAEDIDGNGQFTAADNNGVDDDGNGYVDDVVGWNFSGAGNNDPDDVHGHGTHVAGTIAGDGTGGSQIGVAPGARIMALRESNTIALSTQQECWDGMQYALDNGADIINFSSGWLDVWAPDYDSWRTAVENLMDAGVLFVTIAHNDSSATGVPNNVRTPGRVPLALTAGATDNTDAIAGFSNTGPVSWQGVSPFFDYPWPPGLLKPDVSAPGVSVKSAQNGGGYVNGPTWSGTSMAAPHVAGTAALLLDEDPTLNPYELKYLVEETAVDLGTPGPDNTFGWGRVNALDAVNAGISSTVPDLSITGTSAVWTSVDIWVDNDDDGTPDTPMALSNNHLYARVRNLGGQVLTNVELKFYFADVATTGIGGFDPNGDGDPADGDFMYIGSYRVPTMGPAGSDHATAIGLVNWNIPTPPGDHWCVGIGIVAPTPPNTPETNTANNRAFRNFFDIITSTAGFAFKIAPPPDARREPFALEIRAQNLPQGARVELVLDKAIARLVVVDAQGLKLADDPLRKLKPMGDPYFAALEAALPELRYELTGPRALLQKIRSPRGELLPARLIVHIPDNVKLEGEPLIVLSTLDAKGKPVGGFSLRPVKGTHHQKVGPYPPREAPR